MPVFWPWVMEGPTKTMQAVRKMPKTMRGLTKFMRATPAKRPTAKAPWAPARNCEPRAESVFERDSVT